MEQYPRDSWQSAMVRLARYLRREVHSIYSFLSRLPNTLIIPLLELAFLSCGISLYLAVRLSSFSVRMAFGVNVVVLVAFWGFFFVDRRDSARPELRKLSVPLFIVLLVIGIVLVLNVMGIAGIWLMETD